MIIVELFETESQGVKVMITNAKPTMNQLAFNLRINNNKLWQTIVQYNVSSSELVIYLRNYLKGSNVILASCGSLYFRAGHSIGYWHLTVCEKLHVKEILL